MDGFVANHYTAKAFFVLEVSIWGLRQFEGLNMNFGASFLMTDVTNKQTFTGPTGTFSNRATSDADGYLIPNFGMALELSPGLVIGIGLEGDSGFGADYRDDPIQLTAGAAPSLGFPTPIALPLLVEFISFSSNIALGYEVTEKLSVGVAGTVGFGFLQFGTAGQTTGITAFGVATGNPGLTDFGGTTASTHDVAFGASIGATYALNDQVTIGATLKSKKEYNFKRVVHSTVAAGDGWQDIPLGTPMEVTVGIAMDELFLPGLLVEADLIWKQWSKAPALKDVWDDQFSVVLGARYNMRD